MKLTEELFFIFYNVVQQFKLIFPYWIVGVIIGSILSVFAAARITQIAERIDDRKFRFLGLILAALLGAASPICMYGTVPIIASLGRKNVPQYLLVTFMVSSILINPNLFILSFALGAHLALIRLLVCVLAGILAGMLVYIFFKGKQIFDFDGFEIKEKCISHTSKFKILFSDLHRGIEKTAPYFLVGILLTALFDRYFPKDLIITMFSQNKGLGVLLAASLGVPVYVCGGGTIPLIRVCLEAGMSIGSALAFMITGPATKLTNLSAVKIILGTKNFILYLVFSIAFAIVSGVAADLIYEFFN